jgi:PHD/YefM family antitoxin component YafN of YafNO toxin-antitoxin module
MKTITLPEYQGNLAESHAEVLQNGDIICVNCKGDGKFVLVEESQYNVMNDALKTVLTAASMDDETYKAVQRAAKAAGVKGSYGRDV